MHMQTNHKSNYRTVVKAPLPKVWDALINPELVKQYFFGSNMETDLKVGSPIYFWGDYEGKPYKDKGIIQEYVPNQLLSYTYLSNWSNLPDVPENYLLVTYSVKEVDGGTELTIVQTNYDDEKAKHSEENWKIVIDGLKKLVE
jgi:uncharacterized protein YndB with AHSA1/START domain